MSSNRSSFPIYLVFPLLAFWQVAAQEPPKAETPAAPAKGPADELLSKAIEKTGKLEGMETRFRQQLETVGVRYRFEGSYAAGPSRKVHFEARIRAGDGELTTRLISDGTTVWQCEKLGERELVGTYPLADLDKEIKKIDDDITFTDEERKLIVGDVGQIHGFAGIQPILLDLKKRMYFAKVEKTTLEGKGDVNRVEGEWTKAVLEKIAPPRSAEQANAPDAAADWEKREDFMYFPRKCHLYLSVDTHWPVRIEWRGPMVKKGPDELLFAVEFDPPKPYNGNFSVTEEESKLAKKLDAGIFVRGRRDQFTQQQKREEELKKRRPLDPTLGAPIPSAGPSRP